MAKISRLLMAVDSGQLSKLAQEVNRRLGLITDPDQSSKSLPNQQKPEEEERSEEQDPSGDVECTHHAKTWKANQRHERDEKRKL